MSVSATTHHLQRINAPKAETWNYLKSNHTEAEVVGYNHSGEVSYPLPQFFDVLTGGLGAEAEAWIQTQTPRRGFVEIPAGEHLDEPVIINVSTTDIPCKTTGVLVRKGASARIIVFNEQSSEEAATTAALLKVVVEDHAQVQLTEVVAAAPAQTHLQSVALQVGKDAQVEVRQFVLGGGTIFAGLTSLLQGEHARIDLTSRYFATNHDRIDINHLVEHHAKHTVSHLAESGILDGQAQKTLRATIDLIRGAEGSSGDEAETVLVLSDEVINKTLPSILCNEDDVQGNHGATIGSPSPEQLCYLADRGLSREQAEKLFVEALFEEALIHTLHTDAYATVVKAAEQVCGSALIQHFTESVG